jgi:hypothetical protein
MVARSKEGVSAANAEWAPFIITPPRTSSTGTGRHQD